MHSYRSVSALGTLLVLLAACKQCLSTSDTGAPPEVLEHNGTLYGACKMKPSSSLAEGLPKVFGQVLFKQDYPDGRLSVLLRISGFSKDERSDRAVHIHQYGDLRQGCDSTGGHYNPHGVPHDGHPGDFGNFQTQQGKINAVIESEATLFGGLSVIGRAVVIHEKADDLGLGGDAGSLLHGNAGRRLGCCIIGRSSPDLWDMYNTQRNKRFSK